MIKMDKTKVTFDCVICMQMNNNIHFNSQFPAFQDNLGKTKPECHTILDLLRP